MKKALSLALGVLVSLGTLAQAATEGPASPSTAVKPASQTASPVAKKHAHKHRKGHKGTKKTPATQTAPAAAESKGK